MADSVPRTLNPELGRSQVVEVEKQEYYKLVPTRVGAGEVHKRVIGEKKELGVIEVGDDVYDETQCELAPAPPVPPAEVPEVGDLDDALEM